MFVFTAGTPFLHAGLRDYRTTLREYYRIYQARQAVTFVTPLTLSPLKASASSANAGQCRFWGLYT
jgi:hypothetical protein